MEPRESAERACSRAATPSSPHSNEPGAMTRRSQGMTDGARAALLAWASALALGAAAPPRDLDVAVPPGSPLEWPSSWPADSPPRRPLFSLTPPEPPPDPRRTVAKPARSEADVRIANAFSQVRILTWDLGAHLEWIQPPVHPVTASSGLRPGPPQFGEPMYWLALAPLLRLLLHPDSLSRAETLAHLVELGEPVLSVLEAASAERELAPVCAELRALIKLDTGPQPSPPAGGTPRESALARLVLEECVRDRPLDPGDDFGRRLFLFAEEVEPLLYRYAQHPSLELARSSVYALGRYETRSAAQFLAALAARVEDPVTLVRALAALGRYRGPLEVGPLVARLARTKEPVQRAALIGALGRLGAREATPLLLELGESARRARDSDLMMQVLSALARMPWTQPEPEVAALCQRVAGEAREIGQRSPAPVKPDRPDPNSLRSDTIEQLALLARTRAVPPDEKACAEVLSLPRPEQLDPRLLPAPRPPDVAPGVTDPLGGIPAAVRFLYLEALARVGPGGLEQLAALVRRVEVEPTLRGRALALLGYEQRTALALAFLDAPDTPAELRVQALEILIADAHPNVDALCKKELAATPAATRPGGAERFLVLRALRHLSEKGVLGARDLLPLFSEVQRQPGERARLVAELRASLTALAQAACDGEREKELARRAGEIFDRVLALGLGGPALEPAMRDGRIDALLQVLEPLRTARNKECVELVPQIVPTLQLLLLANEPDPDEPDAADVGNRLFQPHVPLAEEVLLALGRTREPLAIELVLASLQGSARELRGHACLALGMCAQPAMAEKLLPALLDEDPFVRFCASEALRRLTEKEPTIDWMAAAPSERQRAAEELKLWFRNGRR